MKTKSLMTTTFVITILLILNVQSVAEELSEDLNRTSLFYNLSNGKKSENEFISPIYPDYIRWREVIINQEIMDINSLNKNDLMELNLFDDEIITAKINNLYTNILGTKTIYGSIIEYSYGTFIITITEDIYLITIEIPEKNQLFVTQYDKQNNVYYLIENDLSLYQGEPDSEPLISEQEYVTSSEDENNILPSNGDTNPPLNGDTNYDETYKTIDVMIVYTTAAKNYANTHMSGINNVISTAIGQCKNTLENSDTFVNWSLVHAAEVDYAESGDSGTDLSRLKLKNDGYMDEVHVWRDQYNADLVQLFTSTGSSAGVTALLDTVDGNPNIAFSLVKVQYATQYTPAHEFGHNMGCDHHKQDSSPGPGLFSYSAGWRWTANGQTFRTVMSYSPGTRIPYYSNPDIYYQGHTTGDPDDGDNARTIRQTKFAVAAYRGDIEVTRPPYVPHYPSPSNNSNNRDTEVTLVWSGGHPDSFWWNTESDITVYYDIYLGTSVNPPLIDTIGPYPGGQHDITYSLNDNNIYLNYDTEYYWKIVSRDNYDAETTSPVWSFRTKAQNDALDQYFTGEGYTIYSGLHTDDSNNDDGWWWGQSFTPSKNYLSSIDLYLKKEGRPYSTFDIYICDNSSGEPNIDNYLISMSVSPDYIDRSLSWIEFDFFDIYVEPGEKYYILTNAKSTDDDHHFIIGAVSGNHFPDGETWQYNSENHPWSNSESIDLCFKTYGFQDTSENGLDQKQTDVNDEIILIEPSAGGIMVYDKVAQSFIPSLDKLSRIKLMIQKEGNPNEINVAIRNNLNGNNLTIISKPSEEIPDEAEQVEFDFSDIDVVPGNTYYIVISSDGGDLYNHYKLAVGYNTDYINGIFYTFERNNWISKTNTDLWFKTYSIDNGPETYTITASAGPGGNINPSGSIPVNYGEDKTFTITPNTGYHITNVLVDGVSQGAISSYTFTNVIADHTITASFAINQYELKINIEGQGTTNPGEGIHTYEEGYSVRITAIPDTGYLFSHWSGDITGSDNPETIIMDSDKTVTAHFIPENEEHILTISTIGNGTVNKNPDQTTYTHGTIVTLTATPTTDEYIFHHWAGDLTGYDNPTTITIDSDKTITAKFTLRGDVNCDGTVGAADITYVQQIILEDLPSIPPADVDQNGEINILDITQIELIFFG